MATKNKKGEVNVKKCFTLNCNETLKVMFIQKYEPKFKGITFECPKCGRFDKSGNKLNF